ncbi:MAG: MBL fold metallo-hydrolase, partial [Albidovulum sp.]
MRVEGDRLIWPGGELIRLHDGELGFGPDFIPDPRGREPLQDYVLPVQAYLLRRPGAAPLLIDTGSGVLDGPTCGGLGAALAGHGLAPEDIGAVAFTHFHGDHRGGLLSLGFGDAPLHVSGAEVDYWAGRDHPAAQVLADHARRITRVSDGDMVAPGVRVWALPGHTPGHSGFIIDDRIAVVGDLLHRADFQLADPRIATKFDVDPAEATRTRIAALGRIATGDLVLCGGHLRLPGQEAGPEGSPFLRLDATG